MSGAGGTASWRVTVTGASCHVPASQSAAGVGDGTAGADDSGEGPLADGGGLFPAEVPVPHAVAAASVTARIPSRRHLP